MHANLNAIRAMLALLLALSVTASWAGVPNKRAVPAYADEQTMMQVEADSHVPEPRLMDSASGRTHFDRHFLGQYGANEGDVILQRGGSTWRVWRNGPLATIAGTIMVLALIVIAVFHGAVGPARIDAPESGRRMRRFSDWERFIHWANAISFVLLAITGLIILFGKNLLLPLLGHNAFSTLALLSKYVHNFFGPLFIVCSVLMFITFVRRNFFDRWDWQWIKQGGGLVSHKHVPAGFFNAGEKAWFWLGLGLLGIVMSITGLILDFVTFGQTRYVLQVANYLHIAGATLYIAAALGHIYIGTLGTPGAYEAMRHGTVDEEWAKAHHRIWYERVKANQAPSGPYPDGVPPASPPQRSPLGGTR
ncbi:formate dehydrogenase subunit gamma [Massilia horti]|uniref:Formate dehydrogenase subunit gamma n=1 Tax=Massilia horti TaxID=2562153 RepID=A0A4Y9T143_9BURK|nr:formate dehydrogenase subunit gamma [Massilia horti]TFW32570.1 formate dehydrogenase subunit gamma [Massilia horti]